MSGVEVLIVSRRYENTRKCVESVLAFKSCRVFVVVNGTNAMTEDYLRAVQGGNPALRYVTFDQKVEKSKARNSALDNALGEIIYFIDDDAYAEEDIAKLASQKFEQYPGFSFIGGPNLTPASSVFFQRIAGYVLSSPFTAFNMRVRFARGGREMPCDDKALTLCNLAFRRKVFESDGIYFDHRLYYNEENLFLQRYIAKGRKMLYCPALAVYHERRKNFRSFAEQVFRSGEGRGMMTLIMPRSLSAVYVLPFIFCVYLVSLVFYGANIFRVPLAVYAGLNIINAVFAASKDRQKALTFAVMLVMPLVSHISYGAGFVWGLGRQSVCRQ